MHGLRARRDSDERERMERDILTDVTVRVIISCDMTRDICKYVGETRAMGQFSIAYRSNRGTPVIQSRDLPSSEKHERSECRYEVK